MDKGIDFSSDFQYIAELKDRIIDHLTGSLGQVESELEELRVQYAGLDQEIQNLVDEINDLKGDKKDLQEEIDDLNDKVNYLEEENSDLQAKLDAYDFGDSMLDELKLPVLVELGRLSLEKLEKLLEISKLV